MTSIPISAAIAAATAACFDAIEGDNQIKHADGSLDYLSGAERWTSRLKDGRNILHSRRQLAAGGWVFIETDITAVMEAQERARVLERELMQSQKMEALGTLAGGIAHEINTPIQYIGDNLRFLEDAAGDLMKVVDSHRSLAAAARGRGGVGGGAGKGGSWSVAGSPAPGPLLSRPLDAGASRARRASSPRAESRPPAGPGSRPKTRRPG